MERSNFELALYPAGLIVIFASGRRFTFSDSEELTFRTLSSRLKDAEGEVDCSNIGVVSVVGVNGESMLPTESSCDD